MNMESSAAPNESVEKIVCRLRDKMDRLPANACIAFAAHCASLMILVFRKAAPTATESDITAMHNARNLAERVASGNFSGDASTAGSNLRNPVLKVSSKHRPGSLAARAAEAVATVAETVKFSEDAISVAEETVRVLYTSDLSMEDKRRISDTLVYDLHLLLARSAREDWKYNTPVSQKNFSQVWLPGETI